MTPADAHDVRRAQAAAYVLDALTGEERADFEAHLLTCGDCAAEARSLGSVATALAMSVQPARPAPAVRARILAQLAPRASRLIAPWLLLAAASVLCAVGLTAYAVLLRGRAVALEAVLAASDLVRVELAGQTIAPRASARAFWSRSRGLVFTASNLPPLPAGRIYQLWIVTAQMPVGAGLLKPRGDGAVHAVLATSPELSQPVAMALTIEPEGGVAAPTGDKYLVGIVN